MILTSTTRRAAVAFVPLLALAGCVTNDDGRVQQLLNQRGFGARHEGDSNEQYYVGIGDVLTVTDPLNIEFNGTFKVRTDGVIDPEVIDEVYVAGLTLPDLEQMLTQRYREFNTTAQLYVTLSSSTSKWYFIDGEVAAGGRKPFEGDTTLFRAVNDAAPTLLSDDDMILLIRSDPYHPLVVAFDYDDMLEGGWSQANVEIRENDIIYVPPNIFGYITIFTQQLFAPLTVLVQSVFDVNRLFYSFDTFGDTGRYGYGRGRSGSFSYVAPSRSKLAPSRPDGTAEPLHVATGDPHDGGAAAGAPGPDGGP